MMMARPTELARMRNLRVIDGHFFCEPDGKPHSQAGSGAIKCLLSAIC